MQAIRVRFLGPTNFNGPRYKAECDGGSVTIPRDYNLSDDDNAALAAQKLREKLEWVGQYYPKRWAYGTLDCGDTYVFVGVQE
jgi:hypothetical protein